MGKSLQSIRAIAALSVVILGTLAGASVAAVTHTDVSSAGSAEMTGGTVGTDSIVPAPEATRGASPSAQGSSLYARFESPIVTLFDTEASLTTHLAGCTDDPTSSIACVIDDWNKMADAFDAAHAALGSLTLPSPLAAGKLKALGALHDVASMWRDLDVTASAADLAALKGSIAQKGTALGNALYDLEMRLAASGPSVMQGKPPTRTIQQAAEDLYQASVKARAKVGLSGDGSDSAPA